MASLAKRSVRHPVKVTLICVGCLQYAHVLESTNKGVVTSLSNFLRLHAASTLHFALQRGESTNAL